MAGYTDLPFRLIVRSFGGVGLAFTEMLNPTSLLRGGGKKRKWLLVTTPEDRPLGHQVYGKDPALMAEAAKWLEDQGATLIDINMGCPQKKISGRGAGAGLLKTPAKAVEIARRIIEAVKVPVTVKIRLGWENADAATHLAAELEATGIAALTVHGRTREQRFGGASDLDGIRRVREAVRSIPVIANGDVVSVATAREMLERTGCAGLMIGRQALKEPWIIRDVARDLAGDPPPAAMTPRERADLFDRHFALSADLYGEKLALLFFRKWVPQYLRGFSIERPVLASLQQITDSDALKSRVREVMLG